MKMGEASSPEGEPDAWLRLGRAVENWSRRGDARPLRSWLERELDAEGVPRRLAVTWWWPCLERLADAWRERPRDWPDALNPLIAQLLGSAMRFSRPDAGSVFGVTTVPETRAPLVRDWLKQLNAPGWDTVARWWFPRAIRGRRGPGGPPLPAYSCEDRPLAMLRADWNQNGDLLAIDQRDRERGCLLELFGLGRRWLGAQWCVGADAGPARPTFWTTGPYADLAEWSFRDGDTRVTRSALFLRGRHLALLGELREGPGVDGRLELDLPPDVEASPLEDSRSIQLKSGRSQVRVLPIGLPALPYVTDRGSLSVEGQRLILRHAKPAKRVWLPLLVSWDPDRNRRPVKWRVLTVSEKSKACPPGVAFAARVAWGANDSLLIYRSLGRAGLRAFLGHQTRDRFVVGQFDRDGDVDPLLNVEA